MANSAVVGLLRALLVADTAEFDKAMQRAGDSAKQWSRDLKQVGAQAEAVGRTLTLGITTPLVALGGAAAKLAIDFESSFAGVRKTVDASEADFAKLSQQFRDLAKQIPIDVNEINKLGESAGALGIPKEQIVKFVEVMAGLGQATNLTADEAATSIARIQNIFGAAGKDTDRFASTLVALGNDGASTEKEIVEMATRIAGAGHVVGLTEAQVLALSSSMASVGINAEAGGSAMSRVLLKMNDAVDKGGKTLAGFAAVAGKTTADFAQAFKTDAAGAVQSFVEGLQRVQSAGGNLSATLEPLIGKNIILKDTMLRLAGAGQLIAHDLGTANTAWQENSALQNETQKRYETTAAQLTILWNRLKDVGITLGTALIPVIKSLSGALSSVIPYLEDLAKWFGELPSGIQLTIVAFAAVAAAAGPALMAFGAMSSGLGTVVGAFKTGGIAAEAFGGVMTFLAANPIVAVIAGLGLLAGAIYLASTAQTAAEKEVRSNTASFKDQTLALDDALKTYDALHGKQQLTTQETKDLDAATRQLAGASGLTVDAFNKQEAGSNTLTTALREQLKARQDLLAEAAKEAQEKMVAAQKALADAEAQQAKILAGQAVKPVRMGFGGKTDAPIETISTPKDILDATIKSSAEIAKLKANLAEATAAYNAMSATITEVAPKIEHATDATAKHTGAVVTGTVATKEEEKAAKAAAKAEEERAKKLAEVGRAISQGGVLDAITKMNAEVLEAAKSGGLAKESIQKYGKEIDQWLDEGYKVPPALSDIHYQYVLLNAATFTAKEDMKALLGVSKDLTPELKRQGDEAKALAANYEFFNKMASDPKGAAAIIGQITHGKNITLQAPPPTLGQNIKGTVAQQLPNLMAGLVQGGRGGLGSAAMGIAGNVSGLVAGKVGSNITKALTGASGVASMGATIAGGVASMGISLGVQAAVAGVTAIVKHKQNATKKAREDFASQMGFDNLAGLYTDLKKAGAEGAKLADVGEHVIGKQDQAANDAWMKKVQQYYADIAARQKELLDNFSKLSGALQAFGGVAPKSLQPLITELLKSKGLTAEMKAQLEGMQGDPSWQTMQQHAEALGISLAALGPKFQSAKLTDIAQGYARDITMFADAGADVPEVLRGMSDELSTLYQEAAKNKVALPDTLKPYMEQLIRMGLLVDDNGVKITDLNAVAFKDIPDTALKDVVDILKEIKTLLEKDLPAAADSGAADIQAAYRNHPVTIPVTYDDAGVRPTFGRTGNAPMPAPQVGLQGGTHGQYVDWGSGTPVTLHGKERVMPEGEAVGGAGPITITVVSTLDGKEVARNQVRYLPRTLQLAGL